MTVSEASPDGPFFRFKRKMVQAYSDSSFIHHSWYVEFHLIIVERLVEELLALYPAADSTIALTLTWLHDYGKTIDRSRQYELTLSEGQRELLESGYEKSTATTIIEYARMLDRSVEIDLSQAPLEVQIVSSADGCSHLVGPFFSLWYLENPHKSIASLMEDNRRKALKDWTRKVVLPEARRSFALRHAHILEQSGRFPDRFLT